MSPALIITLIIGALILFLGIPLFVAYALGQISAKDASVLRPPPSIPYRPLPSSAVRRKHLWLVERARSSGIHLERR